MLSSHNSYKKNPILPFWLLFLTGSLASLAGVLLTRIYLMDDALITLRYSYNFARLGIPIWNQADLSSPSMGYTSLLWMALNAVPALFTANKDLLVLAAKGFSFAALLAIIWVLCKEISRLTTSTAQKIVITLLVFTQLGYSLHVNSAMETMLFSLWLLLAMRAYVTGQWLQAYIYSALGFLTRPEGAILCAMLILADVLRGRYKQAFTAGVSFTLLLGALYALLTTWYGDFLPNTFYAKQEVFNLTSLKRTGLFLLTIIPPYLILSGYSAIKLHNRGALYILVVSAAMLAYYLSVDPIMNVMSRYQWPVLVLLTYASMPALEHFLQNPVKFRIALAILCLTAVGLNLGNTLGSSYFASATGHAEQNIILIGKKMAEFRQPEKWLIYHDAGAVCYYSDWNTHETIGLTNGQLARNQVTLDDIYRNPGGAIVMRDFDLTIESQVKARAKYTAGLSKYGFDYIMDIPVLFVEGQRNFVISIYARDKEFARVIFSDIMLKDSLQPDFTYQFYKIAKQLFGR